MKLTVELIQNSPDFINVFKTRELDLRENRIPFIENLGATKDLYSSIDLTNNEIRSFENFPLLNSLDTLLLTNNKIEKIEPNISTRLPALKWLNLTNNHISSFQQLSNLFGEYPLRKESSDTVVHWKLSSISLMGNEVCKLPYYREWMIFGLPSLRLLDFVRVDEEERKIANSLFLVPKRQQQIGEKEQEVEYSSLFHQLINGENVVDRKRYALEIAENKNLDEQKKKRIKQIISSADSLAEIEQIERNLLLDNLKDTKNDEYNNIITTPNGQE